MERFYFDNAGTTRVFDEAARYIDRLNRENYFNPSALYAAAQKKELEDCRAVLARLIDCEPEELFFTSCATEANNWALTSGFKNKKGNIVVSAGEHASVYECAAALGGKGLDVRFLPLGMDGRVDLDKFGSIADKNTCLVSVIACSNETGAVNDIDGLKSLMTRYCPYALLHCDAVQAFVKLPRFYRRADMISVSAHKLCGPKGVGALYIDKAVGLSPFIAGGGQERKMRSGTENTAGIAGFAAAAGLYDGWDKTPVAAWRNMVKEALLSLSGVKINEAVSSQSPFILSASVSGVKGEILQRLLFDAGYVIGLGSACSAKSRANRVLEAMGLAGWEIEGSIRISFGPYNDDKQCEALCEALKQNIVYLRGKING